MQGGPGSRCCAIRRCPRGAPDRAFVLVALDGRRTRFRDRVRVGAGSSAENLPGFRIGGCISEHPEGVSLWGSIMSQALSVALTGTTEDNYGEGAANVTLRGTARGLEILITGTPTAAALGARLTELLAEAPGFFAGSNARVAIDGMLPLGALACLEEIAARFELRL